MGRAPAFGERADRSRGVHAGPDRARHYHIIESAVGDPGGYRDDVFRNRRLAIDAARNRAQWLATVAGCRVEPLLGPPARYLITTGQPHDAGRMIAVEECDDPECLTSASWSGS